MSDQFPTPLEIKALAEDYGYVERRPEASRTLFFKEEDGGDASRPVLVNVFYTTRGIMTKLPHPKSGYNSLWRTSAYDSLESLAMLFEDPRAHTGKGYRQAKDAVRGCAGCGHQKKRGEYSQNQWKAGPGKAVCKGCVAGGGKGDGGEGEGGEVKKEKAEENGHGSKSKGHNGQRIKTPRGAKGGNGKGGSPRRQSEEKNKENHANGGGEAFPRLSLEALKDHDRKTSPSSAALVRNEMERRQFNCPLCPEEGRGKHVFFKRVPADKPVVKCPKCKRVNRGDCERLYPIPKGEEKGYGFFRCPRCNGSWGSCRAIMNIGQQCNVCVVAGRTDQFVRPFRMEVQKSGGGIAGGGPRPAGRRMRRVPKESIGEDAEVPCAYSPDDQRRFQDGGGNAISRGGGGGGGRSFDWEERGDDADSGSDAPPASRLLRYKKLEHKCEGCVTGVCRSRKLPVSGIHDVHDGDTASTSGSIVTNSEVDKSEFVDRDLDFNDWESDDGAEVWVAVGKNGKMLRG
ncbi:hypothetical protein ACHAWF_003997 [Thalassiosira exigua]